MDYEAILREAHAAATAAQRGLVEDRTLPNCGFAWVTIDGKSKLAHYCRRRLKEPGTESSFYGNRGYPLGWAFWCPGHAPVQQVSIHEAGARAFRDVLARYDIRADVGSRLD